MNSRVKRSGNKLIALFLLSLILLCNTASPVQAHTSTVGYSDIAISGKTISYQLYLNPEEVAQWMDTRSSKGVFVIDKAPVGQRADASQVKWTERDLMPLIQGSLKVKNMGVQANPSVGEISLKKRAEQSYLYIDLKYDFSKPVDVYEIDYGLFFDDLDPMHQNFSTIRVGDASVTTVFHKEHRKASDRVQALAAGEVTAEITVPGWLATMLEYTKLGIEHIWTGIDHLLFIAALVIVKQRKRDYIKILTAFTVGHSVTIALASLELVNLPSRFIEPVIALSIVYVAVENIWMKKLQWRWAIALSFGLIHGFGFAQVLSGAMGERKLLSLFSFNLGVEVGQIVVLAVLLPLLIVASRGNWYRRAIYGVSGVIAMFGLYWFVERLA